MNAERRTRRKGRGGRRARLPPSATASCRCCLTSRLNVPNAGAWQGLFKHVAQAVGCTKAPRHRMFSGFRLIPPPLLFASRLKSHPQFCKSTRSKSVSFAQGQPDSGRSRTHPPALMELLAFVGVNLLFFCCCSSPLSRYDIYSIVR